MKNHLNNFLYKRYVPVIILSDKLVVSLSNLATSAACQYKNEEFDFTCPESTEDTDSEFCIFHDRCYLKGDNYEKHTEKIAEKFKDMLSKYSSSNMPLKFIGYCLPDISFQSKQFTEALNFSEAMFYAATNFYGANSHKPSLKRSGWLR